MSGRSAIAVFAHPDDIEFVAAGTLLRLKQAGWRIHYMNLSSGNLGSAEFSAEETSTIRRAESQNAAEILGAAWHPSIGNDMEILYTAPLLRKLTSVIREVRPDIVLTHSPQDYMEDHMNTSRLAVSAAFSRGMPNFVTDPAVDAISKDVTLYHAMPHGLRDQLGQLITAETYIDTTAVHAQKREALAAHASQKSWLDRSQGMDSYLISMDEMSKEVGLLSGEFLHAEGWRRHLHLGFSQKAIDPLTEALA